MKNRNILGFQEYVRKAFTFLTLEYGFRCTEQSETYMKFETNQVFVSMYHGRQSYEIGLEIGLIDNGQSGYGLGSLISIHNKNQEKQYRLFIAKTREQVISSVENLAKLLKEYGHEALKGDKKVFIQLNSDVNKYWEGIRTSRIKNEAAISFSNGDYETASRLYEKVSIYLSPSEKKKLEIAKKKLVN